MRHVPAEPADGRPVPFVGRAIVASHGMGEPDLSSLRWLARHVLAQDVVLSRDVPTPRLVSAHLKRAPRGARDAVRDYLLHWIRHPEAGSNFEAMTRRLRWLPGSTLVRVLFAIGYDGIVYSQAETIVGHVFFQRRGTALHGFSTAVDRALDGDGHSVVMMLDYVAYGAQLPGITRARVGTGRNNAARRLLARIKKHERNLGWRVGDDGWVTFSRGAGETSAGAPVGKARGA
jgi:hypothetical protein